MSVLTLVHCFPDNQDAFRMVSMAASCLLQAGAGVVLLQHGALGHPKRDISRYGNDTTHLDKQCFPGDDVIIMSDGED